jgi:hypothetical protein
MGSGLETSAVSKGTLWIGYVLSALPVLMLVLSGVMKIVKPAPLVQGFNHLGYPESLAVGIGILELICTAIILFQGPPFWARFC